MYRIAGFPKYNKKALYGDVLPQSGYLAPLKNPSLLVKHPLQREKKAIPRGTAFSWV